MLRRASLLTSASTLLLCSAFLGCPATVEVLESTTDGEALSFDEGYDAHRFRLDISTPEEAFPGGEDGFSETVTITAVLKTDLRNSGDAEVELLVSDLSDQDGAVRHGQSRRVTVFGSDTELLIKRYFYSCDAPPCVSSVDIDFLKSGDAPVTGTWHVEHAIDWYGEGNNPPAHAISSLDISAK